MNPSDAPPGPMDRSTERRQWLIAFAVTFVVATVGAFVTTKAWKEDLSVPFEYGGDGLMALLPVKTMLDTGWWYEDDHLGAPVQMAWYDFPVNPNIHIAILKVMSLFERDPFRLLNYYVLLGFPLVAVCALAAFRTLRLPIVPSVFGSLIFAFAPYHFWRGFAHPWLSSYFTIPLGMIAVAWVLQDRPGLFFDAGEDGRWKFRWRSWRTVAAVLCCAALGFDFPYYPVFLCFLMLVAGIYVALNLRSWRPLVRSGVLISMTAGFFALNLMPNILYRIEHGPNISSAIDTNRNWNQAEYWGLKIVALLMPAKDHPIPAFEALRAEYHSHTALRSSEDSMALGTLAAGGFIALLGWSLLRLHRGRGLFAGLMDSMSVLNLACVLLATVGGLGVAANLLVLRLLRCYDRISIVIMFLAVVPACVLLAAIERRAGNRPVARAGYLTLTGALLVCGVWEQSRYFRIQSEPKNAVFAADRAFINEIEAAVGPDAAIFQYPIQNFLTNSGPAIAINPYSQFRGYLHSSTLTWSTGAVEGRLAAKIQEKIGELPTTEAIESIALLGFDGVYLDRTLFRGAHAAFEAELHEVTGAEPIVSSDSRLVLFPLTDYLTALHARTTPQERLLARQEIMSPMSVDWIGFDPEEVLPKARYRWCQTQQAQLRFNNFGNEPRTVGLNFFASGALPESGTLKIEGPSLHYDCEIALASRTPVSLRLTVPPGSHDVTFATNAKPLVTPARNVVFRIDEFAMHWPDAGHRGVESTAGRIEPGSQTH